ncbi:MAG: extracellular solute-binding protein [Pseudonocardiaceae bacterium]
MIEMWRRLRPMMSIGERVRRGLVMLSALMVASVVAACASSPSNAPAASDGPPARGGGPVSVLYAGTLVGILERHLGPAFDKATGYPFQGEGKGTIALANLIKAKVRQPDVFLSADVAVNKTLQGPANGDYVRWWVPFDATEMVIAWSPRSRFAADFQAAKDGKRSFESVLTQPGLRFGRADPELGPKGYRTMFIFDLDAKRIGDPTLPRKILGGPGDSSHVFPEEQMVARLQAGEFDAGAFYKFEPVEAGLPYLSLPKEINLGDVTLATQYATATYTTKKGTTYTGAPVIYTVTIPSTVRNPGGAQAFVRYLLGPNGQAMLVAQGLNATEPVVAGDPAAVPPALRPLVKNR